MDNPRPGSIRLQILVSHPDGLWWESIYELPSEDVENVLMTDVLESISVALSRRTPLKKPGSDLFGLSAIVGSKSPNSSADYLADRLDSELELSLSLDLPSQLWKYFHQLAQTGGTVSVPGRDYRVRVIACEHGAPRTPGSNMLPGTLILQKENDRATSENSSESERRD